MAVDGAGNAYLVGHSSSTDFPTTPHVLQPDTSGDNDAVIVKLNADGSNLLYSTYLGGSGPDRGLGIAIDSDGNAYVTGCTGSMDFPTVNPLQAANAGDYDGFVAKVNDGGSLLFYSTYVGGSGRENCPNAPHGWASIALRDTGDIFLTGSTGSADFPTVQAYDAVLNGGAYDAFVIQLDRIRNPKRVFP